MSDSPVGPVLENPKCGRCAGDKNWGPLHYPSCERGKEIGQHFPRNCVAVIVATIEAMDSTLDIPIVDHIAAKAVLRYAEEDTGLNCAAENAYLTWSRERGS